MKEKILDFLGQIERDKKIKILYAAESGSRAWGFPSPDSDYDIRFIYQHEKDWYLTINEKKDQITIMPDHLLDGNGWDLRKFLRLLYKSNATPFEWLNSPIIYREEPSFTKSLKPLVKKYFQPKSLMFHYLGIATSMLEKEFTSKQVKIKKYFYVLRPVLSAYYISKFDRPAPVDFHQLLSVIKTDKEVYQAILKLLKEKETAVEGQLVPRVPTIDTFVDRQLQQLTVLARDKSKLPVSWDDLNEFYKNYLGIG